MDWAYYAALVVVLIVGFALNLMTLPGLWVMVAGLAGYALITGWGVYVGWAGILTVFILAVLAEILEFIMGGAAAAKAGGSFRAGIGALIGGLLGALFLGIPIPILGIILGACLGTFAGALIAEFTVRGDTGHSTRIGYAAAVGRLIGIITKMAFGVAILLVAAVVALPLGASSPPLAPTTAPATLPATGPATAPATTTAAP